MTDVAQLRVALTGSAVTGGGVATFYSTGTGSALASAVRNFWLGVNPNMPGGVTITVPSSGLILDSNTGSVTGAWSGASTASIVGGSADPYPKGVGARVVWGTDGFTNGRRVRGSTYIVPLAGNSYEIDGTLANAVRTVILNAAISLQVALGPAMVILTRPNGVTSGVEHSVTSVSVPDKVAWLSSRRD